MARLLILICLLCVCHANIIEVNWKFNDQELRLFPPAHAKKHAAHTTKKPVHHTTAKKPAVKKPAVKKSAPITNPFEIIEEAVAAPARVLANLANTILNPKTDSKSHTSPTLPGLNPTAKSSATGRANSKKAAKGSVKGSSSSGAPKVSGSVTPSVKAPSLSGVPKTLNTPSINSPSLPTDPKAWPKPGLLPSFPSLGVTSTSGSGTTPYPDASTAKGLSPSAGLTGPSVSTPSSPGTPSIGLGASTASPPGITIPSIPGFTPPSNGLPTAAPAASTQSGGSPSVTTPCPDSSPLAPTTPSIAPGTITTTSPGANTSPSGGDVTLPGGLSPATPSVKAPSISDVLRTPNTTSVSSPSLPGVRKGPGVGSLPSLPGLGAISSSASGTTPYPDASTAKGVPPSAGLTTLSVSIPAGLSSPSIGSPSLPGVSKGPGVGSLPSLPGLGIISPSASGTTPYPDASTAKGVSPSAGLTAPSVSIPAGLSSPSTGSPSLPGVSKGPGVGSLPSLPGLGIISPSASSTTPYPDASTAKGVSPSAGLTVPSVSIPARLSSPSIGAGASTASRPGVTIPSIPEVTPPSTGLPTIAPAASTQSGGSPSVTTPCPDLSPSTPTTPVVAPVTITTSSPGANTSPSDSGVTLPGGVTLPDGVTLPSGVAPSSSSGVTLTGGQSSPSVSSVTLSGEVTTPSVSSVTLPGGVTQTSGSDINLSGGVSPPSGSINPATSSLPSIGSSPNLIVPGSSNPTGAGLPGAPTFLFTGLPEVPGNLPEQPGISGFPSPGLPETSGLGSLPSSGSDAAAALASQKTSELSDVSKTVSSGVQSGAPSIPGGGTSLPGVGGLPTGSWPSLGGTSAGGDIIGQATGITGGAAQGGAGTALNAADAAKGAAGQAANTAIGGAQGAAGAALNVGGGVVQAAGGVAQGAAGAALNAAGTAKSAVGQAANIATGSIFG